MTIHFQNDAAAVTHLQVSGFQQIKNGNWVSRDGTVAASIHPAHGEVVCVCYREVLPA